MLVVSSVGSVAITALYPVVAPSRSFERGRWPRVEVIDRSDSEPGRQGLISERLVPVLRGTDTVVCILNRKGRAALLVCASCGEVSRCERCGGAHMQRTDDELTCIVCAQTQPIVCGCGSSKFKNVRMGVTRAREELEALAQRPCVELTAETTVIPDNARLIVGTEAALHRVPSADVVVFLDFDSELFASRYRASEQAFALIARAASLVSHSATVPAQGARVPGTVLLQTRVPEHDVVRAAVLGDPQRFLEAETQRRQAMRFPPFAALAEVSGAGASSILRQLDAYALTQSQPIEVVEQNNGSLLVRAGTSEVLADALAACERPAERVRVEVDPLRL